MVYIIPVSITDSKYLVSTSYNRPQCTSVRLLHAMCHPQLIKQLFPVPDVFYSSRGYSWNCRRCQCHRSMHSFYLYCMYLSLTPYLVSIAHMQRHKDNTRKRNHFTILEEKKIEQCDHFPFVTQIWAYNCHVWIEI